MSSSDFFEERKKALLNIESRRKIYEVVRKNTGCHFREIQRRCNFSVGSTKYHLDFLVRNNLLSMQKDNQNIRYYPVDFLNEDIKLLNLLGQKSIRKILIFMTLNEDYIQEDIISYVNLSPSTVSWHLKKLEDEKIILSKRKGRKNSYILLIDKKRLMSLLIAHRESFFDRLVDNAVDMWEL